MKTNILFFIEELRGGGAEKVLCDLVNAMDPERFRITVQTLWRADAAPLLKPWIRYKFCYDGKSRVNGWRSRLEAAAGLTYPLHMKDDYDIEVAYLEFGSTKILAGSTNKKAKKAAWVHCDLAQKIKAPQAFAAKAAGWYEKYDRVVCVSETVKDSFDRLFGTPEKSLVLYNTVDDGGIRAKAELVLPEMPEKRRLTAVTVGRLAEEKRYDRLIHVHQKLLEEGLDQDLWIVGEGDRRGELEALIAENGLADSVKLLGFQSNPYPFMKAADLLVCSSRYEGLSTFVTEGLVLGKPIVTTDCSGMRELLGDSEYGVIVENDETGLRMGLERMLRDAALRADYAARAAERGRDFSAKRLAAKTEDFFIELLRDST